MNADTLQHKNRSVRVLIVEDNKGDVMLIKRAFGQSAIPHEIMVARTGEEALGILEKERPEHQPDMILLDLNLPGLSGHQVLSALKAHEHYKRIPVFIFSSSCTSADVTKSYDEHANCYIVKPHDLSSLCDIADRIGQFWFSLAILPIHEPGRRLL